MKASRTSYVDAVSEGAVIRISMFTTRDDESQVKERQGFQKKGRVRTAEPPSI